MINYDNGIMNIGDVSRIKNTMIKALKGEPITVGFLGGSITQGSLSSTPENCYAYLVYDWFKESFKEAKVTYVNAGIGGTPSNFGVARADEDLLRYEPDFAIVEFSVNDAATDFYMETYEGLVRHILSSSEKTGLMQVMNVRYDNMESAEDKHFIVGKYYNLPSVSMKHSVYPEVACGNINNRDITPDDLHPNDKGHRMLADLIINLLEKIKSEVTVSDVPFKVSTELPKPITCNGYEKSKRLRNINFEASTDGFEKDETPQNHITEMFRYGYTAWNKGNSITYNVKASSIQVQYRKTINLPTPVARAIIDDDYDNAVILDGNFDETWGDCLFTQSLLHHGELKKHNVKIEITEDHRGKEQSDKVPFYLVSLIVSE